MLNLQEDRRGRDRELQYKYRHILGEKQVQRGVDGKESVQVAVDFNVYYDLGGINHWHGTREPRGVWVSVSPI